MDENNGLWYEHQGDYLREFWDMICSASVKSRDDPS